jgi:catechol 2,3-dioxygenase-like lactoylglutathione lyase family enzyme
VPDVFDHVTIRVSDLEASRRFYELALAQLGYGEPYRGDHFFEWEDLSISTAREDKPATRSLHLALLARSSRDEVDSWWEAMTAAGHPDDGAPGPRPTLKGRFVLERCLDRGPTKHVPPRFLTAAAPPSVLGRARP